MFGKKSNYAPSSPSAKEIWDEFKQKYPRNGNGYGGEDLSPKEVYLLRREIRERGLRGSENEILKIILEKRGEI